MLLAIDPGTTESGFCFLNRIFDGSQDVLAVGESGVLSNNNLLDWLDTGISDTQLAIEMFASQGMPVGQTTFDAVRWIGRFQQAWRDPDAVRLIYRHQVKMHICGHPRAKDANIRQALIDKLGPVGTKAARGPLYGVKSHAWSALAVAVTALEGMK